MSASLGLGDAQPPRRSEPHEARWELVERRERFARAHPEVLFRPRRDGGRLLFDASVPRAASVGYDDARAMLDDLESRYPAR